MPRRDDASFDLFEVPKPAGATPGSIDYRAVVAHAMADMLRKSGKDRWQVAAEASRLAGKDVSKYMLDGYTAESREEFNLPAYLVPVIEVVCESHAITQWLAGVRGGRLMVGRDALAAELGRIERQRDELAGQARALKDTLRRAR